MSNLLTTGLLILAIAATTTTADDKQLPFKITTKWDDEWCRVRLCRWMLTDVSHANHIGVVAPLPFANPL